MTPGFLIKKAANGVVVIKEVMERGPQGVVSGFIVDPETTWIFKTFEEAGSWIGMNITVPASSTSIAEFPRVSS